MNEKGNILLYDKNSLHDLDWEVKENGEMIKNYFTPLIVNGVDSYIDNIKTELCLLEIGDKVYPVTINEKEYENSHVCSLYTHYVTYTKEELKIIKNKWLRGFLKLIVEWLGVILKIGKINKVVQINNWFTSTNLHSAVSIKEIQLMIDFFKRNNPKHAILFKTVNESLGNRLLSDFQQLGFIKIPTKQVYIYNPNDEKVKSSKYMRHVNKDYKLLKQKDYKIVENKDLTSNDANRLHTLYQQIFIEKYSLYNVQFNEKFFGNLIKKDLLHLKALKKDNVIEGFIGYVQLGNTITNSLLGHNENVGDEVGLYRQLNSIIRLNVDENELIWNQSGGVPEFKKRRGAKSSIEYNLVYMSHLPWYQRLIWKLMNLLYGKVGVSLAKKYKF